MITKKSMVAGAFSLIIGIGMLATPLRAMAQDPREEAQRRAQEGAQRALEEAQRHAQEGAGREAQEEAQRRGFEEAHGRAQEGAHRALEEAQRHAFRDAQDEQEDEDEGAGYRFGHRYGNGYGFPFGQRPLPRNGEGMINPSNPNQIWACDSHGHHCHWAQVGGY